ncbi:DUF4440 domain-containing protein [Halorubrum tropicale]|uniref:DUF4440 domain-containing protein n=1 Tax=Halorubrum tropicale TaxID=1765655 RepID=UPI001112C34A|nr:nuclear transport factor 2 family protein [Halorubrum tropicale]
MGSKESLLELERQLWNADEEFYRDKLSEDAVMVFPEPTGILDRSAVLESLGGANRWQRIEFGDEQLLKIDDDIFQLVYRAVAERSEDGSDTRRSSPRHMSGSTGLGDSALINRRQSTSELGPVVADRLALSMQHSSKDISPTEGFNEAKRATPPGSNSRSSAVSRASPRRGRSS